MQFSTMLRSPFALGTISRKINRPSSLAFKYIPVLKGNSVNYLALARNQSTTNAILGDSSVNAGINLDGFSSAVQFSDPSTTELLFNSAPVVAEPTFQSLGLGGWWLPGMFQNGLELLHCNAGLPWWAAICAGTITVELLIKTPLTMGYMKIVEPSLEMKRLQLDAVTEKITEAKNAGGAERAEQCLKEEEGWKLLIKYLGEMLPMPIIAIGGFLCCFYGIYGIVDLPVESLKTGGVWWFTDLTAPDRYGVFPVLTCLNVSCWIKIANRYVSPAKSDPELESEDSINKYLLIFSPFLMIPLAVNCSAASSIFLFVSSSVALARLRFL